MYLYKKRTNLSTSHKDTDFSVGLSPWTRELNLLYVFISIHECGIGLRNLQLSLKSEVYGLMEFETFCNCLLVCRQVRCLSVTISLT